MIRWLSPAKLNLFLYITGRREDGYHNLQTLFQFIDYYDYLTFEPRDDNEVHLLTEFNQIKHDDNLIIKAVKLLLEQIEFENIPLQPHYGMNITIEKNLPMGGGLGGGSSNAATTLIALNHLWNLKLSTEQLIKIGRKIGADVPIFIFGHSAIAQGIGDELQQVEVPEKWYLIVKPEVEIATAKIFNHPALKRDSVIKEASLLLNNSFKNDCEPTVRYLYPEINHLIKLLSTKAPTRLTGTGSCIFSECETKEQAETLQLYLNKNISAVNKTSSFIAKGINSISWEKGL